MQNLYENFLQEIFYTRSNYCNLCKSYENIFTQKFLHENKANYGTLADSKCIVNN